MKFPLTDLKKIFSIRRIKVALKQFMLFSGVYFFVEVKLDWNYDEVLDLNTERTLTFLKIAAIYYLIYFIFYKVLKYILRYLFHSKLRDKVIKERANFIANPTIDDKKFIVGFTNDIAENVFKYVMKMGLVSSTEISVPMDLKKNQKEDFFNEVLEDQYSWILIIFHSLVTTLVVYQFYAWWFIAIMILIIVVLCFFVLIMVYILLHLEVLELIRRKLVKRSKKLM